MQSTSRISLTDYQWELIFKSLELSRNTFINNPVLQDVMPDEEREYFIDQISDIMDLFGWNGGNAAEWGIVGKREKKDARNQDSAKPNG